MTIQTSKDQFGVSFSTVSATGRTLYIETLGDEHVLLTIEDKFDDVLSQIVLTAEDFSDLGTLVAELEAIGF